MFDCPRKRYQFCALTAYKQLRTYSNNAAWLYDVACSTLFYCGGTSRMSQANDGSKGLRLADKRQRGSCKLAAAAPICV